VIAAQNGYDLRNPKQAELAMRDAVNNEILAAEAKRLGYEDDPEIRRYVKSQAVQKLLLTSVDSTQQAPQPPTDAELKAYYDANIAEFTPPTLARAQVLALLKRKDQEASFSQKLDAVKQAIESKQVTFSQLVEQFSDDPAAKGYGGTTNWLVKGEENKRYPQELIDKVFAAADDKTVAGPITNGEWTYFVKLQERRGGQATPFAQAKSGIERNLMRRKRLDAYTALVKSLESKVTVQTFPDKGPPAGPAGPVTQKK
jgi:parvulin-like peptidyl-prolyl isomerase